MKLVLALTGIKHRESIFDDRVWSCTMIRDCGHLDELLYKKIVRSDDDVLLSTNGLMPKSNGTTRATICPSFDVAGKETLGVSPCSLMPRVVRRVNRSRPCRRRSHKALSST